MPRVERIQTDDGSWTLRDVDRDITFRSTHGARTESRHVFVTGCRVDERRDELRILELGFGGAMNFEQALAARVSGDGPRGMLHYLAVEAAPVDPELVVLEDEVALKLARTALAQPGERAENTAATLTVYPIRWQDAAVLGEPVDAIFHDPFAPKVNPDCWTQECFEWHKAHAHEDTLLATYSAAGHVRRAMAAAGWYVTKVPGPGRKREVTLAARRRERLGDLCIAYSP